ncbi:MAG: DUF4405 domain-containing protein [Planctomycetales bacterium]|nr:DUF4405 domain-containing protein [Planctomycetales bacterium]
MDSKKGLFRFRPFVSILTGFSFLAAALTGAILFITPPGRVANWTGWTVWGLTKHEWTALHVGFCAVFIAASVLHIWLNFRPLVCYFIGTVAAARTLRLEWMAALLLCGAVYWGSIKPFAPFSSLQNLSEQIKNSWSSQPAERPPVPHAELLTVEKLAQEANLPVQTVLENLTSKGIEAVPEDIFGTLAEQAGYSPEALFAIATGKTAGERHGAGGGTGRGGAGGGGGGRGGSGGRGGQQTIAQACQEMGIELNAALEILHQKGITATADQTFRQIAEENNLRPGEIRQYLEAARSDRQPK